MTKMNKKERPELLRRLWELGREMSTQTVFLHQAIAQSAKPAMVVLDFAGNAGRHKLISTTDILGGKYSEEARERAAEKIKSSTKPVRLDEALKEAERDIKSEVEERRRIEAERKKHIKGRAKRFAKVGGEMVSLAAVEMLAAELWPDSATAVTAIPDARKGERLIMVTNKHGATRSDFIAYARSKHASELMFPAEVIVLDKLPMLGSGKVDNIAVAKFVREQAAAKAAAAE